jgi:hypothetical protein
MQHGTWSKVGAQWPNFSFSGKPVLSIHLEDLSNLLDYFDLLITSECAKLLCRETNQSAQQFLENMLNLK